MQTKALEDKFEQERHELRDRLSDMEKKLQERTQQLGEAESMLTARSVEFEALTASNKELDELREMKEVLICLHPITEWRVSEWEYQFVLLSMSCCHFSYVTDPGDRAGH